MFVQFDLFSGASTHSERSPTKDRQDQAEQNADDDAGDEGKIKGGVLALDPNITGQPSQPFRREPAPHHQTHERDDDTDDDCKLPKVAHTVGESCAD